METEDDMIVLVVVDDDADDEKASVSQSQVTIKTEPVDDSLEVNDIIETAEKHGEYIPAKVEPSDDFEYDYLEDEVLQRVLKSEANNYDDSEDFQNSLDYMGEEDEAYSPHFAEYMQENGLNLQDVNKHRFSMLKPWQQRSFVAELRQEYPELKEDEELLINTLEQIMRSVKPPPPPRDYYIMNGIMFECVQCGSLSETIPAASRHYQEKHGQRYLVCYACGVDFRSTTNLYKHEKRCVAPDARTVLRARASVLGRRGRARPYLRVQHDSGERIRYPCQLCSAVFLTRRNLQSHENLHRGERPYRCHVCPCAYTSYSALSRHTKKHTDIQFICDLCNRSFKIKAALVQHMNTHKPLRKYGCTECSRRFAQKSALVLHVNRVHLNLPPPCACQICPKRYPRMSLLKAHMKRAHGMSIMTRKMFFKSLPTMTELEIKQSKVVLKSDDDVMIEYDQPYNTEEMFQHSIQEDIGNIVNNSQHSECEDTVISEDNTIYEDNTISEDNTIYEENTISEDNASIDFMQYIRKGNKGLSSNVIYIQNGEIVQGMVGDDCNDKFILEVEAMVSDDGMLVQTLDTDDRMYKVLPVN